MGVYILFRWAGPPVHLAGVLHALLCLKVYPDTSVKRDELHVHLLLCHAVLQKSIQF